MSAVHNMNSKDGHHKHYIIPIKTVLGVGLGLYFLTGITVLAAHIDLGVLNLPVAMLIASVKASLVALIFMNLKHDDKDNGVIFGTSFLFLAIFFGLVFPDVFFRGDVYVKPGDQLAAASVKSTVKQAWLSNPELVAKGKEMFAVQCVACHGVNGMGDGPAAAALNPHPRNFHIADGWKNGRKPSQVFKTLKEGVPGSSMASFATLPPDDRWALTHYLLSLGPTPPQDTNEDLAKIGIDPTKADGGGGSEEKTIPVAVAMKQIEIKMPHRNSSRSAPVAQAQSRGGKIYQASCVRCHGETGGGMSVRNLTVQSIPGASYPTMPLASTEAFKNSGRFSEVVLKGIPGDVMPGSGQLSQEDVRELYQYVQGLVR